MPTVSDKQAGLMLLCADNPDHPKCKEAGISQQVAREFVEADRRSGRLKSVMRNRARKKRGS